MHYHHRRRRRQTLRCSLCGQEISLGEEYWACNGATVCVVCLPAFARQELAPCHEVHGKETHL